MNGLYTLIGSVRTTIDSWSTEKKLFWWSILFLFILLYAPNNKILLALAILFICGLLYVFKSIRTALLYSSIFCLPFQSGKSIDFLVVSPEYVNGRLPFIMSVGISLTGFMVLILIYLSLRDIIYLPKIKISTSKIETKDIFIGTFLILNIFSSIISPIPLLSFLLLMQFSLYIYLYYYIQQYKLGYWVTHHFLPIFSALGIFEGFISILQFINKGPLGKLIENSADPSLSDSILHIASEDISFVRIQGTFSHPNSLGFFIALILPLLFYYSIAKRTSNFGKKISSFAFIASFVALLLSASRLSWIIVAIELLYIYKKQRETNKLPVLYKISGIIGVLVLPILVIPRLSQFIITFGQDGGANFRWNLIIQSFQIVSQNPFGIGLGTFPQILLETIGGFSSYPTQPHNLFAQILVASGYAGLLSFMLFLCYSKKYFLSGINEHSKGYIGHHSIYLLPIISFMILSQFYPILTEQQIIGWLWVFLSILPAV